MAFFEMKYYSDALHLSVSVNVVLPDQAKTAAALSPREAKKQTYPVLYLLHGLSDDESIWERRTSVERYAADRGIAVVMPAVGRSWYTDTAYGANYFTFLTDELPVAVRSFFRGISDKREDTFIAGLSMGGYGAVKAALTYPERYAGCVSLSGALDIADTNRRQMTDEWRGIFGFDLTSVAQLSGTKHDVFALAEQLKSKAFCPDIYLWCGEQDSLMGANERFTALLNSLRIPYRFDRSEGNHSWKWWDLHITDGLDYLLEKGKKTK